MAPAAEKTDPDSDEDDFMEKVNVYLNTRDSSMGESSNELEGILRRTSSVKSVKFAMDQAEIEDAKKDGQRSRHELLNKISRLTDMLKESEDHIAAERDKRKKKEKNLMKLAKELKKRNAERERELEKMEEVSLKACNS